VGVYIALPRQVVEGKTMAADCFYEGQGRLDGSLCGYSEADKMAFVERLFALGVRNVEMESNYLGAFGKSLGVH
jgi:uridine phosphorylase